MQSARVAGERLGQGVCGGVGLAPGGDGFSGLVWGVVTGEVPVVSMVSGHCAVWCGGRLGVHWRMGGVPSIGWPALVQSALQTAARAGWDAPPARLPCTPHLPRAVQPNRSAGTVTDTVLVHKQLSTPPVIHQLTIPPSNPTRFNLQPPSSVAEYPRLPMLTMPQIPPYSSRTLRRMTLKTGGDSTRGLLHSTRQRGGTRR